MSSLTGQLTFTRSRFTRAVIRLEESGHARPAVRTDVGMEL
jgi:hypothetical protein